MGAKITIREPQYIADIKDREKRNYSIKYRGVRLDKSCKEVP